MCSNYTLSITFSANLCVKLHYPCNPSKLFISSIHHSESKFKHNKYETCRNHTQNVTTHINLCIITHYPCKLVNVPFPTRFLQEIFSNQ